MMFELNSDIDDNKIFLVNFSELDNRLDPVFYSKNLNLNNFIKLKKIAFVKGGKRIPKGFSYSSEETDYLYLRVSDFTTDNGINWDNVKYISKDVFDLLKRYQVFNGDIIFSIAGTVGKTKLIKNIPKNKKVILTENAAVIHIKNKKVLPESLFVILGSKILQKQIDLSYVQTTIPKIGLDRIENLLIPNLNTNIQQQIIDIYETAYQTKQKKEAEAERLLESIDDYLLGELGITLPERDNSLEKRMFTVSFRELSGKRFDAPVYYENFSLKSRNYPMEYFKYIVSINPFTPFSKYKSDTEVTFVPMENICEKFGEVNTKITKKIKESKGYTRFVENDILWAKITPSMQNGKSAIAKDMKNGIGFGSTEFHIFRKKSSYINMKYLLALLRLKRLRKHAVYHFSGSAGHQRVSEEFFLNLQIPLPPMEKQNQIASHIENIHQKAKQLRAEAKEVLEQAKEIVEKMIQGE